MKKTKSARRLCSILFAWMLTLIAVCASACSHSGDISTHPSLDKATLKVTMGEEKVEARSLAPADAVKYRIYLFDKDGARVDEFSFAAEGQTNKEFNYEYTENGDSREMIVKTGALTAESMRVACYNSAGKYMGSGLVGGMKLEAYKYYSFDNTSERDNSFDYLSAEDEAIEGELFVTAEPSVIAVGEKAELKAFYTNPDGFTEDVTENNALKLETDSENIELNGHQVTGLADGAAIVAATLTLTPSVQMASSVNVTVGERAPSYSFLRKVDGKYTVINSLLLDRNESLEAEIAYGYIDDNGNAEIFAGKYAARTYTGDASNGFLTVSPADVSTESCLVTADLSKEQNGDYVYFEPDDCPGVICASLPVAIVNGGGSRGAVEHSFLEKLEDGSYKPIDALFFSQQVKTKTVAYGDIDENGEVKLYNAKFEARDCFEDPNGYITVTPSGSETKECTVVIDTDKPANCNYLYCEPDYPRIICASLPVIY
ncbi:hypothetical protein IJT93_11410 [bacterium]|nr:hypothetical protein [bacterium]